MWTNLRKLADSMAVPLASSAKMQASTSPIPSLAVGTNPAPGLKGPKGLAPRTNYSRVNAGAPPAADVGAGQKAVPPDPNSMLRKAASEDSMISPHMTIQQMVKAAAASVQKRASIEAEAARHQVAPSEVDLGLDEKVASAHIPAELESISTETVEKLACAVEYVLSVEKEAAEATVQNGPGDGPTALKVQEAQSSNNEIEAGGQGQATSPRQPPMNPSLQKDPTRTSDPGTGLETNDDAQLPPYPEKISAPIDLIRKTAASFSAGGALRRGKELLTGSKARQLAKDLKAHDGALPSAARQPMEQALKSETRKHHATVGAAAGGAGLLAGGLRGKKKEASGVDSRLVDAFLGLRKQAEDAVNPARSASGEPGGAPVGGQPQGSTHLVASNEAAINATKGQAKEKAKQDVGKVVEEPAQSAATDKTLGQAFEHTEQAGTKISSSMKSAAARALLEKLSADAKKKVKSSMGGGQFQAPPVGGVASGPAV